MNTDLGIFKGDCKIALEEEEKKGGKGTLAAVGGQKCPAGNCPLGSGQKPSGQHITFFCRSCFADFSSIITFLPYVCLTRITIATAHLLLSNIWMIKPSDPHVSQHLATLFKCSLSINAYILVMITLKNSKH